MPKGAVASDCVVTGALVVLVVRAAWLSSKVRTATMMALEQH